LVCSMLQLMAVFYPIFVQLNASKDISYVRQQPK
jgi:hypothetical protein